MTQPEKIHQEGCDGVGFDAGDPCRCETQPEELTPTPEQIAADLIECNASEVCLTLAIRAFGSQVEKATAKRCVEIARAQSVNVGTVASQAWCDAADHIADAIRKGFGL